MPRSVNSLLERTKTSCDNQTYLFVFGDESIGHAFHKDILDAKWESRILSKQYFESQEFKDLSESERNKMLHEGVAAYDADEVDPETNKKVQFPSVYKYILSGGKYDWVKTNKTAEHKIVTDDYGITQDYYAYFDENETYRLKYVMKRTNREPCPRIYYKNSQGMWIDYYKYINSLPTYNIDVASINWPHIVKLDDISVLPKCRYIDANGYVYDIDAGDGKDLQSGISSVEVDTNNWNDVNYEPFSIDSPELPFSARHIMTDLKITIPEDKKRSNFLCWLNGSFVPTIQDSEKENVLYIQNAMYMVGSRCVNQILGAKHNYSSGATVVEDTKNNEYRYDVNLRFFGWKNVAVSDFYKPYSSEHTSITHNYESIYPIKTVTFPVNVNKDAHIILCNGKVLDPDEYIIGSDGKTVTFKNVESEGYELLNEIITDINENASFYENVNPLKMVSRALTNKTYSLVNFSSEEPNKNLKLLISSASCVNFPYKNEVTFPVMNIGDLILLKGLMVPFEWIHKNTIRYPRMANSYTDGVVDAFTETDVKRYYFVLEDK